jgi:hypothetical protein
MSELPKDDTTSSNSTQNEEKQPQTETDESLTQNEGLWELVCT